MATNSKLVNTPFLSRKVIASTVTGAILWVASFALAKFGLDTSAEVAAEVSAVAGTVGAFVGGYAKRELPNVVSE